MVFRATNIPWYILSVLIPLLLTGISALVLAALFSSQYRGWSSVPVGFVLNIAAMLLGSIGEEIGWRGYLLPALGKKLSPLAPTPQRGTPQ